MIGKREEEYLETIYEIVADKGYAKVTDVAKDMNLGPSAVTEMFQKLDDKGYIDYKKYSGVTLTKKGKVVAKNLINEHEIWEEFFRKIGLDSEIAAEDACRIEHIVNPHTTEKIDNLVTYFEDYPEHLESYFEHTKKSKHRG
ncbi:MAG: metal-dependent transcriptional regulator [Thermoplasmatota archaeon]